VRSPRVRAYALVLFPLSLLLAGCGGDDASEPAATVEPTVADAVGDERQTTATDTEGEAPVTTVRSDLPIGTVTTDAGTYEFAAQPCYVSEDEATISGIGTAPDGRAASVDVNITTIAYLGIEVGIDDFASQADDGSDTFRIYDLEYEISGSKVTGSGALTDTTGAASTGNASFEIDCG